MGNRLKVRKSTRSSPLKSTNAVRVFLGGKRLVPKCKFASWYFCHRCHGDDEDSRPVPDHSLPYFDSVGADPTLEEMHKVVCVDGRRPRLPTKTKGPSSSPSSEMALSGVSRVASECWYESASARLTAFRVKKSLAELLQQQQEQRQGRAMSASLGDDMDDLDLAETKVMV